MNVLWRAQQRLQAGLHAVQRIVLHHEHHVKQDREQSQTKLSWVTKDGAPVAIVVGDQKHLGNGQRSSSAVKQNIANAPSRGALASVVVVGL